MKRKKYKLLQMLNAWIDSMARIKITTKKIYKIQMYVYLAYTYLSTYTIML